MQMTTPPPLTYPLRSSTLEQIISQLHLFDLLSLCPAVSPQLALSLTLSRYFAFAISLVRSTLLMAQKATSNRVVNPNCIPYAAQ